MNKPDDLLKQMANQYIEQYGQELKKEFEELERNSPPTITPGLDAKVKAKVGRKKTNYGRILGLVAACLLVAVIVPVVYNQVGALKLSDTVTMDVAEEAASVEAEEAAPAEALEESATDEAPAMEVPSEAWAEDDAIQEVAPQHEVIALGFELPENFTVSAVEQDVAKTIYYLDDSKLDDTVLTMEYADSFTIPEDYQEYDINGQTAYGQFNADYSILVFEKDGIVYELTCEHDLNTLIELGAAIL